MAVTDKAMSDGIVEELNRPLNYQPLRKRKTSFGSIRIGARTADLGDGLERFEKPLSLIPPEIEITVEYTDPQHWPVFNTNLQESDSLEEFARKVMEGTELPPLKFIQPGQIDLDRMADEMSQTYGANPTNVRKMLEIWSQYLNQDHLNDPDRRGNFDRAPKGRDVLRHRETGVKVYVVRRRYGTVTLQSEDGQEFALNNDIVETVYEKEYK